jgi:hypothetical protein
VTDDLAFDLAFADLVFDELLDPVLDTRLFDEPESSALEVLLSSAPDPLVVVWLPDDVEEPEAVVAECVTPAIRPTVAREAAAAAVIPTARERRRRRLVEGDPFMTPTMRRRGSGSPHD